MMNALQIRTIVGIIGNVISFGLFLAPSSTIYRIYKKKSVEEFLPDPYIACVINCILWIFYGLPFNHPNSTLVITINAIGLAVELSYLAIFWINGENIRWRIHLGLIVEVIILGIIVPVDLLDIKSHNGRSIFVGIASVICCIIMYGSPLTIMHKVVKTKSVEFMPFLLSLAGFLNGACWTAYALLQFDLFILIPNGTGAFLGLLQLILYACYFKTTPKKNEKPDAQIQLEKIEIANV